MATVCDCNSTFSNVGTPNCVNIGNVTYRLIGVPTYDSTGVKNFIDTTATLDDAYFTAALNNTDDSKRWYPLPVMKNVESTRGEDITESFNDGSVAFIQEGTRAFTGISINNPSPVLYGKIKNWRCSQISVFVIDIEGNILGNGGTTDKLYPFRVDSETWSPKYMMTTDTSKAKIQLDYTYSKDEDDADIRMIASTETTPDVRDLEGLIDVNSVVSGISTTGFTITSTYDYGTQVTKDAFKGAVTGDWVLAETSPTPGAITITSATEGADGVYVFVIPTATSADVLSLTLSLNGYEMDAVTITIP